MPVESGFGGYSEKQNIKPERAFRVNRSYRKILRNRKQKIERRLDPKKAWSDQPEPIMKAGAIHYEKSARTRAVNCGGIGAVHTMVKKIGLAAEIDVRVHLLKRHLPNHESDHVLNLAYNAMLDGVRLQDIELRRNDEAFLDGLGAQRIPDPTTSGDFTRRFSQGDIVDLMDAINTARRRVWNKQGRGFLSETFIDVDGTIAGTTGECKRGDESLLQKDLRLRAAGGVTGQHQRGALRSQQARQRQQPSWMCGMDRPGHRSGGPSRRGNHAARGHRLHADRGTGPLARKRPSLYFRHGRAPEGCGFGRGTARAGVEAIGAAAALRNCHW